MDASTEDQKERERAVFNNEDDDDDDSSDSESESDNPIQQQQSQQQTQTPTVTTTQTATVATTPATAISSVGPPASDVIVAVPVEERRPLSFSAYDESRRLFQRLWTDDDEIKILQGFFEFTSKRGTTFASHQYDTGPFYEDIKVQLNLDFTKNQLIEKLRRLKKKYRNCVSRMRSLGKDFSFKSAHERAIYDIARNIWSASVKRARDSDDEEMNAINSNDVVNVTVNEGALTGAAKVSSVVGGGASSRKRLRRKLGEDAANAVVNENSAAGIHVPPLQTVAAVGVPSVVEETVKSCLSPLFKELISSAIASPFSSSSPGAAAAALNLVPMSIGSIPSGAGSDEKWKKQQILELEVYLKRIELVRDHIKATLEEMRSSES